MLRPDVVVASLLDKRATRELLKEKGPHLAEFSVPRSLDEVKDQIREMGGWNSIRTARRRNHQARCRDRAARQAVAHRHYRVLPLSRRGWVSGSESLLSSR